jgi:hypothetical protein
MTATISWTFAVAAGVLICAVLIATAVAWWSGRRPRGRDLDTTNAEHYRIESDDEPE